MPRSGRTSSGSSQSSMEFDKNNGESSEPSSVSSTKLQVETLLEKTLADGGQDPAIPTTIATKVFNFLESLEDLRKLDSNEQILVLKEFFGLLALLAKSFDRLNEKGCYDLESFSKAIEECICRADRIVNFDTRLSCDENFVEIMEHVSATCCARQPHSKRHYVALIKIHHRLLEMVDDPRLPPGHIAALVHNMEKEIRTSLMSSTEQNWKLVAFLVKRMAFLSAKFAFLPDDHQFIGTVEKLWELRVTDHPLSRGIEKVELWKLVNFEKLKTMPSESTGVGHVLVWCDISENMPQFWENISSIEFCIREIYRHASDVFQFMFHRVGKIPLFDHCLRILIRSLRSVGEPGILRDIVSDRASIEQRLLHDELCRYIRRKRIPSGTEEVSSSSLVGYLKRLIPSQMTSAELQLKLARLASLCSSNRYIRPHSSTSALLSSLVLTHTAKNAFGTMSLEEFVALVEEQIEILMAHPRNDCLFFSACTLFSYARDFPLSGVEDQRKQTALVKLKEIALWISQNDIMNAFGATSVIVFAFATDLPKWLSLRSPLHEKYLKSFEKKFDRRQWNAVLLSLQRGEILSPPENFYSMPRETQPVPPPPIGEPGSHTVGVALPSVTPVAGAMESKLDLIHKLLDCSVKLRHLRPLHLTATDIRNLEMVKADIDALLTGR